MHSFLIPWSIVCMSILYFALVLLFPFFFNQQLVKITKRSFLSIAIISGFSILVGSIVFSINNDVFANRFQHAFMGGFLAFLVCYLSAKDSRVSINKFQFFFFSLLIVTSLGVVNEMAEYIGQNYTPLVFSNSINDTWLDLISNTIGSLIAGITFTPFFKKEGWYKKYLFNIFG